MEDLALTPAEREKAKEAATSAVLRLTEEAKLFDECSEKQTIGANAEGETDGKSMVSPP